MNLYVCAKFGPDRTTGDDVYTVGRIHTHTDTHTHTHTLSYIDIDYNGYKLVATTALTTLQADISQVTTTLVIVLHTYLGAYI